MLASGPVSATETYTLAIAYVAPANTEYDDSFSPEEHVSATQAKLFITRPKRSLQNTATALLVVDANA